ncbi:hypothetical protein BJ684DRAFT_14833 [Piptocephalis cylindrospora]|uniref:Myb-like domain-containing protein n=1 Tax=Piptocephalis cylindrospora TaxID=1907219 RepID=A0A4P9Y902_9FUNG|nr:hypothetical protein BJ684DRAFT_14833 [Piptocephalis cylindrospora]|eukprot:RKP14871.1 hypothetical protein BJ684DRAFT_14833 [Piptocephalis cylindrospora]
MLPPRVPAPLPLNLSPRPPRRPSQSQQQQEKEQDQGLATPITSAPLCLPSPTTRTLPSPSSLRPVRPRPVPRSSPPSAPSILGDHTTRGNILLPAPLPSTFSMSPLSSGKSQKSGKKDQSNPMRRPRANTRKRPSPSAGKHAYGRVQDDGAMAPNLINFSPAHPSSLMDQEPLFPSSGIEEDQENASSSQTNPTSSPLASREHRKRYKSSSNPISHDKTPGSSVSSTPRSSHPSHISSLSSAQPGQTNTLLSESPQFSPFSDDTAIGGRPAQVSPIALVPLEEDPLSLPLPPSSMPVDEEDTSFGDFIVRDGETGGTDGMDALNSLLFLGSDDFPPSIHGPQDGESSIGSILGLEEGRSHMGSLMRLEKGTDQIGSLQGLEEGLTLGADTPLFPHMTLDHLPAISTSIIPSPTALQIPIPTPTSLPASMVTPTSMVIPTSTSMPTSLPIPMPMPTSSPPSTSSPSSAANLLLINGMLLDRQTVYRSVAEDLLCGSRQRDGQSAWDLMGQVVTAVMKAREEAPIHQPSHQAKSPGIPAIALDSPGSPLGTMGSGSITIPRTHFPSPLSQTHPSSQSIDHVFTGDVDAILDAHEQQQQEDEDKEIPGETEDEDEEDKAYRKFLASLRSIDPLPPPVQPLGGTGRPTGTKSSGVKGWFGRGRGAGSIQSGLRQGGHFSGLSRAAPESSLDWIHEEGTKEDQRGRGEAEVEEDEEDGEWTLEDPEDKIIGGEEEDEDEEEEEEEEDEEMIEMGGVGSMRRMSTHSTGLHQGEEEEEEDEEMEEDDEEEYPEERMDASKGRQTPRPSQRTGSSHLQPYPRNPRSPHPSSFPPSSPSTGPLHSSKGGASGYGPERYRADPETREEFRQDNGSVISRKEYCDLVMDTVTYGEEVERGGGLGADRYKGLVSDPNLLFTEDQARMLRHQQAQNLQLLLQWFLLTREMEHGGATEEGQTGRGTATHWASQLGRDVNQLGEARERAHHWLGIGKGTEGAKGKADGALRACASLGTFTSFHNTLGLDESLDMVSGKLDIKDTIHNATHNGAGMEGKEEEDEQGSGAPSAKIPKEPSYFLIPPRKGGRGEGRPAGGIPRALCLPERATLLLDLVSPVFDPSLHPRIFPARRKKRVVFNPAEDALLVLGKRAYGDDWHSLRTHMLPAMSTRQLFVRYKNLVSRRYSANPVRDYHLLRIKPLGLEEEELLYKGARAYGRRFLVLSERLLPERPDVLLRATYRKIARVPRAMELGEWKVPGSV